MNLNLDEARYGKTFLLLFKVCAFTLRRVIDNHHGRHGYTSLQDFLDKNKHNLYHILKRCCCCGFIQSSVTPMNWPQWNLLFIKNSSSCRTGYAVNCPYQVNCPCQYNAKPGITSDVMDITLCCLVIKNICSRHGGINMLHIETIREIRNDLIHANSPCLDLHTFNGYWKDVKTALSGLANHVPSAVYKDALNMIQELETRVMDAYELGEIRKVIVDQNRIEKAEEVCTIFFIRMSF
ncbi:hypothetical protein FSP39_016113 [Pinctada imbricata]|uniref:DZIP3-like HEPN domain-containing protein n=1 Tax=Pinctada imbricata TaxID=66713 RepID=A0AA88XGC9_PINIB|nr:hypothetical protein FSP39_016113 [Pinctada imbricata]